MVFGILTSENEINIDQTKYLINLSRPLKVVFHMAFDEIADSELALQTLIELGVDRVLTKGCKTKAIDGLAKLQGLFELGKEKITILAGGKVTQDNYENISKITGIKEFHGKEIVGNLKEF